VQRMGELRISTFKIDPVGSASKLRLRGQYEDNAFMPLNRLLYIVSSRDERYFRYRFTGRPAGDKSARGSARRRSDMRDLPIVLGSGLHNTDRPS